MEEEPMTALPVAFDLDGTLSDSSEGIVNSINYALGRMGRDPLPRDRLLKYIGPPITEIFQDLLDDSNPSSTMEAVQHFRTRYVDIGFMENRLYDGIPEMLETLKADGHPLYVATSKRPDMAVETLRYLGLEPFFRAVHGCGIRRDKHEILNDIVSGTSLGNGIAVMVGDRKFDIAAGRRAALKTIGVTWGFGTRQELEAAGADRIVDAVSSVQSAVKELTSPTP